MGMSQDQERKFLYKCPYCKKLFHERPEAMDHIRDSHKKALSGNMGYNSKYESAGSSGFSVPFSNFGEGRLVSR